MLLSCCRAISLLAWASCSLALRRELTKEMVPRAAAAAAAAPDQRCRMRPVAQIPASRAGAPAPAAGAAQKNFLEECDSTITVHFSLEPRTSLAKSGSRVLCFCLQWRVLRRLPVLLFTVNIGMQPTVFNEQTSKKHHSLFKTPQLSDTFASKQT